MKSIICDQNNLIGLNINHLNNDEFCPILNNRSHKTIFVDVYTGHLLVCLIKILQILTYNWIAYLLFVLAISIDYNYTRVIKGTYERTTFDPFGFGQ